MNRLLATIAGFGLIVAAGAVQAAPPPDNSAPVEVAPAAPAQAAIWRGGSATPEVPADPATVPSSGAGNPQGQATPNAPLGAGGDAPPPPRPAAPAPAAAAVPATPVAPVAAAATPAPANCSCAKPAVVHHVQARHSSAHAREARLTKQLNEQVPRPAPVLPPPTLVVSYTRLAAASQATYATNGYPQPNVHGGAVLSPPPGEPPAAAISDSAAAAQGSGPSLSHDPAAK